MMSIKTEKRIWDAARECSVTSVFKNTGGGRGLGSQCFSFASVLFEVPSGPNSSQMGDGQALFGSQNF